MKRREEKSSLNDNRIKTFSRGLKALELLCRRGGGITQSELARALGVDRSTALRFLATLVREGYAWREDSGAYRPTMKPAELSCRIVENLELRRLAHPFLQRLADDTALSAHLAVFSGGRIVYADGLHGPGMVRVNADVGATAPVHCAATGKALSAHLEPRVLDQLLAASLDASGRFPAFTGRTITDPALLQEEFERIRAVGYAVDDEEYEPGVRCLAAPVFDLHRRVIAAVGVSGIAVRLAEELLPQKAELVCSAAGKISRAMGCNPGPAGLRPDTDTVFPEENGTLSLRPREERKP